MLAELFPEKYRGDVFIVGGAVRDKLLDVGGNDTDITVNLPAETMLSLGFRKIHPKSIMPIYSRTVKGIGVVEATLHGPENPLEEELRRRDFTINAIAMNLRGEYVDPLDGRKDVETRTLRLCSPSALSDDPARIFRLFRFMSDWWKPEQETLRIVKKGDWKKTLEKLPVERFTREMIKSMEALEPSTFFRLMVEYDAGRDFFPELFRLPDIPAGPLKYHPEGDMLTHSCETLDKAAEMAADPVTRLAAFMHDIGKTTTDPEVYPSHHGHDEAGFALAAVIGKRLRLPANAIRSLRWTCKLHQSLNRWTEMKPTTKIRKAAQALKAGIEELLPVVVKADGGSLDPEEWRRCVDICRLSASELGAEIEGKGWMTPNEINSVVMQERLKRFSG